ncbi:SMP-30/gluconolactonase/LRE family protein [Streptomyces sp. NBC_00424]|uniref:SMP-30/gluconolactonase/LRE family protein n=1 Tax=Streptomyces sp. NBC_00424 TaxID=2903648 RepID=UPI00224FFA4B|nr:SMP-30/gluconolactonase/LRE family protein [Streptomyces sp. NBC_00424]MCX5077952.1 SMP-30/gluconolactonase/LRE family protein [Streptomyces sp. NBC_00424]
MFKKLSRSAVSAAVLVAAATAALAPTSALASASASASASAESATLSRARIAAHFELPKGQTPENLALAPGGAAYVTFAKARQIAEVSPNGTIRILATLPKPADGGIHTPALGFPLTVGIVRAHDGTLYFLYATGTPDLTGVWRLRPGGQPQRIAALPAAGLPNGLALDPRTRTLYVTDSVLGTIWRVPTTGGTPTAWSTAPELAPTGFLGANGLKIHNGAVWATNLDKGTVLRIPVLPDGRAGRVRTKATGLPGIDDFAFTGRGDQLLAALNGPGQVALVQPDGSHSIALTRADGLQNPTAIALRGKSVYVTSAAYVTAQDPNLLRAHLNR